MPTLVSHALPSEFVLLFEEPKLFHALTPREQDLVIAYVNSGMNDQTPAYQFPIEFFFLAHEIGAARLHAALT